MRPYVLPLLAALASASVFVGTPAAAQPVAMHPVGERLLSVVGEGIVRGRPDMAVLSLAIVSEADTAREALSDNTETMSRLIAALRDGGIDSRDLQTANFSVEPRYSQPPANFDGTQSFEPRIVGYMVRNELTVRVRDLARTGAILDQVVTLGANSISGPTFAVADPTELEDAARRAAMRDAMRKAELYAGAADISLGPISRIEETVTNWPQPLPMAAMAREVASDAVVPVESGELSFQAQVSVTWSLED